MNQSNTLYLAYKPFDLTEHYRIELENMIDLVKVDKNCKVYDLSFNGEYSKFNEDDILNEIKNDNKNNIILVTSNNNLFTNFYKPVQLLQDLNNKVISHHNNPHFLLNNTIDDIFTCLNNKDYKTFVEIVEKYFFMYGNNFEINLNLLTKKTTYPDNVNELKSFIHEDLKLLEFKNILTSRLAIIVYRLIYFDFKTHVTSIGRLFVDRLGVKSKSFKFTTLNNSLNFNFTDLSNRQFRGYKIIGNPFFSHPLNFHDEKIKIAKKLLRSKVKMKIVSDALDISEEELNDAIYGITKFNIIR